MKSNSKINRRITDEDLKLWEGWIEPEWSLPNFTMDEVRCRCCGRQNMNFGTISKFQKARDILGLPIYMVSYCRCIEHNKEIGGKWDSAHIITPRLRCHAGDVTLSPNRTLPMGGHEMFILMDALRKAGFVRFGLPVSRKSVHADDDTGKVQNTMWFYK